MNISNEVRDRANKMQKLLNMAEVEKRGLTDAEQAVFDGLRKEIDGLRNQKELDDVQNLLNSESPSQLRTPRVYVGEAANTKRIGSFLQNVARCVRGESFDSKLINVAGLSIGVGSDGGFLLGDVGKDLLAAIAERSKLLKYCNVKKVPEGRSKLSYAALDETSRATGSRSGGALVQWVPEAGTATVSKPKLRLVDLPLSKLLGFCPATNELLEDAGDELENFVTSVFLGEMAWMFDDAILNGSGNGVPLGILKSQALVTTAKRAGQTVKTVVYENLLDMYCRVQVKNEKSLVWLVNRELIPELGTLTTPGLAPQAVFLPKTGDATGSLPDRIFNIPVLQMEQCSTIGDAGDIILADMSDYIVSQKTEGPQQDFSIHVYFDTDQSMFRWRWRVNGAPYTKSALTSAANSGFKTSPYVTLAQR